MPDELLTAGAVARRLGVAVTTLRTWHQRYGLGPSVHEPGQHRRYDPSDVARLELMQRLVGDGMPPAEAARWAKRADSTLIQGTAVETAGPTLLPRRPGRPRRDGGRGLALGTASPAARGLSRAAMRLDGATVRHIIANSITQFGVATTWDTVLRPVLVAIGPHGATGEYVEVEHLISGCISAVLGAVPRPPRTKPTRIMLACADEEQHSLPIEALSAALAAEQVPSRLLGARVPPFALQAAVSRTGPAAVLIYSAHPTTADPAQLAALVRGRDRPFIVAAGGPGWDRAQVPTGVLLPGSLTEALTMLRNVAA